MSVNKAIIIGNLTDRAAVFKTNDGKAIVNVAIATNKKWKDKSGDMQNSVEYHKVVFFNRLAEIAGEYLKKGSKVYIEGALRTRQWEKDGITRYTTEIIASEMQMLDTRGGSAEQTGAVNNEDIPF